MSTLFIAVILSQQSEGGQIHIEINVVRVYRVEIRNTKYLDVDLSNLTIARLSLSSQISGHCILRDVKFLDEGNLIIVASPNGILPTV
jgi:hypothetical protein